MKNLVISIGVSLGIALVLATLWREQERNVHLEPEVVQQHIDEALSLADNETRHAVEVSCRVAGDMGSPGSLTAMRLRPQRVFDNLYHIGTVRVSVWALVTHEGIVLIDSLTNQFDAENKIVPGLLDLGLDPNEIRYVIVTHAHFDHYGGAKYFQEHYGARIVMGAPDWDAIERLPAIPRNGAGKPERDIGIADGQELTLSDTTLQLLLTPGHTRGTLSVIFPVRNNGEQHMAALWGGNGTPNDVEEARIFLLSLERFAQTVMANDVDVLVSNHEQQDFPNRLETLTSGSSEAAHPLVLGQQAIGNFLNAIAKCTEAQIARLNS